MEDIERELEAGNTVMCANIHGCDSEIVRGDRYVMRGKYMYCDDDCAEADERKE